MPKISNMKVAHGINDILYFFGGYSSTGLKNELYTYDIEKNIFEKPFVYGETP